MLYQRSASNDVDGREIIRSPEFRYEPHIRPLRHYPNNYYQTR